jgi:glutaminyl-peptide cyclotransferase
MKASASKYLLALLIPLMLSLNFSALLSSQEISKSIPVYSYQVVNTYPHNQDAYTQGLIFESGFLYEGTGRYGRSSLRKVELETGKVLQLHGLPSGYFGEGITLWGDQIIQLTWLNHTGFVYDKSSFKLLKRFYYTYEGWGITHDDKELIISDGSATLHFWDPVKLEELGSIEVHDDYGPVKGLNELEYVQGQIYANIYTTDLIAIIEPSSGQVMGWINLKGIINPADYPEQIDVLNGIAYDWQERRLFVTGKLWPKLFEIQLSDGGQPQRPFSSM